MGNSNLSGNDLRRIARAALVQDTSDFRYNSAQILSRAARDAFGNLVGRLTDGFVNPDGSVNLGPNPFTPPFSPRTQTNHGGGYQQVRLPPGLENLPSPERRMLPVEMGGTIQSRSAEGRAAGGYFDILGRAHRGAQIEAARGERGEGQPIWQQHIKDGENTPAHEARRAEELQKFASDIPKIRAFLSPDQQKMLDAAVTVRVTGANGTTTFKSPTQRIAEWESLERSLAAKGNSDALFEVRALRRLYPSLTTGMDGGIDNNGINTRAADLFKQNGQAVTGMPVAPPCWHCTCRRPCPA